MLRRARFRWLWGTAPETTAPPSVRLSRVCPMYRLGSLVATPVLDRLDLVAPATAALLRSWSPAAEVGVAEIDPDLADTATLVEAAQIPVEATGNCVLVAGRRAADERVAACVVPATTRTDVNRTVKRLLEVRKASFLPMDRAVELSGMEYGGITPVGLPLEWRLLVHAPLLRLGLLVIGSGVRRSKLVLPGRLLGELPQAEVIEGLGQQTRT